MASPLQIENLQTLSSCRLCFVYARSTEAIHVKERLNFVSKFQDEILQIYLSVLEDTIFSWDVLRWMERVVSRTIQRVRSARAYSPVQLRLLLYSLVFGLPTLSSLALALR